MYNICSSGEKLNYFAPFFTWNLLKVPLPLFNYSATMQLGDYEHGGNEANPAGANRTEYPVSPGRCVSAVSGLARRTEHFFVSYLSFLFLLFQVS